MKAQRSSSLAAAIGAVLLATGCAAPPAQSPGGGCTYTGEPMDKVHKGLKNTEAEMHLLVQFLRDALDRNGVGTAEKNELLRILAPMKRDIVTN